MVFFGILLGYATTYDFFTVRQIERIYFIAIIIATSEVAVHQIHKRMNHFFKLKNSKS